ncbi:MAG: zinc ribbon domain-containing protein [Thermoplasmatota archaeon]
MNPRGTSQECSACGAFVPKPRSEREHRCSECGLVLGRDENAAINILHRARTEPSWRARNERPIEARSPGL